MRNIVMRKQPLGAIRFGVMTLTLSVLAAILGGCSSFLTNP